MVKHTESNQSCAVKREVIAGFLMGFHSLIQKLIFITLDASMIVGRRQKKGLFSRGIYSEHFIMLLKRSWGDRESSPAKWNYGGQLSAICHNKLEGKKMK